MRRRRAELDPAGELLAGPGRRPSRRAASRASPGRASQRHVRASSRRACPSRRIDTYKETTLAARRDRHVSPDQEGETAEHLLLREVGLVDDEFANPLGETLVVGHQPDRYVTTMAWTVFFPIVQVIGLSVTPEPPCRHTQPVL